MRFQEEENEENHLIFEVSHSVMWCGNTVLRVCVRVFCVKNWSCVSVVTVGFNYFASSSLTIIVDWLPCRKGFHREKVSSVANVECRHFLYYWKSCGEIRNQGMLWREIFTDMKVVRNSLVYGPLLLGRFSKDTFIKKSRKCENGCKLKVRFPSEIK